MKAGFRATPMPPDLTQLGDPVRVFYTGPVPESSPFASTAHGGRRTQMAVRGLLICVHLRASAVSRCSVPGESIQPPDAAE